jgi:DNA polymerase-3 subunit epsilon
MEKLFIYDVETTGIDHVRNGIHQLSFIIVIDGEIQHEEVMFIKPDSSIVIEEQALQVANVTREQLMKYSDETSEYHALINILSKFVDRYNPRDKFHLVGYNNSSFDNKFLRAFFERQNDKYFGSWFWSDSIDVMALASLYLRDERYLMSNFKLATVAEQMGIMVEHDKLHDATYDIYLTKTIFDTIKEKLVK